MNNLKEYKNWALANGDSNIYFPLLKDFLKSVTEINEENINIFIAEKKAKYAIGYVNNYISAIRNYLKFKKIELRTPTLARTIQTIPNYITLEFLENQIIPDLPLLFGQKNQAKIKVLLYFMFYSGLRKSEIITLKKENFDFKNTECKVYIKKTKEERLIPLTEKIMRMIIEYSYDHPSETNIFDINEAQIDYICSKIAGNYKIKFHPHSLRHSMAMHMKKMGFDLQDIGLLLGHKNINSTLRYAKADIKEIKNKFKERIK